ncbi:MAG TPA: DUF418 domain-containing protein [Pyrinomonadaceae bacterium]|nr:DUF418 domain-containing protein [Pyrinomonadaceae bacterium]
MSQRVQTVEDAAQLDAPRVSLAETARLEPVAAQERIQLIDVLRGFALFGVLLANMVWLSGEDVVLTEARAAALPTASIDRYAKYFVNFFVDNKANTIFAFLFGLGFAVQLIRAEERGVSILPVYVRRLFLLLLFGLAHMLLLWYGDILHLYALMGFVLILFRRSSDKTLIAWGVLLAIVPFSIYFSMPWLFSQLGAPPDAAGSAAALLADVQAKEARLAIFAGGSYFEVIREHLRFNLSDYVKSCIMCGLALYALGRFLIGYYVGRRRLLHEAHLHLPLFRRLLVWGLVVGVIGNAVFVWVSVAMDNKTANEASVWAVAAAWIINIGIPAMSLFYVSGIVLLFQRPLWQRRLLWLAPVGRMALTNYLMQTVFHLLIFYGYGIGLGLVGRVGTSLCILFSLAIFTLQILYSRWWLARFRFGPAEWLWRTLTYGARPRMRVGA